jgi:hypothetical protein
MFSATISLNRPVSVPVQRFRVGNLHHLRDALLTDHGRNPVAFPRAGKMQRRIDGDLPDAQKKRKEGSQRGYFAQHRSFGKAALHLIPQEGSHVGQADARCIGHRSVRGLHIRSKLRQVRQVRPRGILREPPLRGKVGLELLDGVVQVHTKTPCRRHNTLTMNIDEKGTRD